MSAVIAAPCEIRPAALTCAKEEAGSSDMSEKTYTGGCHCGEVRYEVTADINEVVDCNCSRCQKLGALWLFVNPECFALRAGEDSLADYQFNRKVIHHLFCQTCGIESFARGVGPGDQPTVAVNVRCLDNIDLAKLKRMPFDGRSV
jgi:hypothetical protein